LNRIADYKNGNFYYIENNEDIGETFANCLGELISLVADNIQVSLESLPTNPETCIS